jgi:multiple antibiotic resistance protein
MPGTHLDTDRQTRITVASRHSVIIVAMSSLNFADMVVTFLALLGPQKVLLAFGRVARTLDRHSLHVVIVTTTAAAICIGLICDLTAPWLATFFHLSDAGVLLAGGLVFFVDALCMVLGIHFDVAEPGGGSSDSGGSGDSGGAEADPTHPLTSGFRAMLLPFVVSPLAVAAALEISLSSDDWSGRWLVAGAFTLVAIIDAGCALLFAPLLGRAHEVVLDALSRLLSVLLAAVGVELFLGGLTTLGLLNSNAHLASHTTLHEESSGVPGACSGRGRGLRA